MITKKKKQLAAQSASRGELSAFVRVKTIIALVACIGTLVYTVKRFVNAATVKKNVKLINPGAEGDRFGSPKQK